MSAWNARHSLRPDQGWWSAWLVGIAKHRIADVRPNDSGPVEISRRRPTPTRRPSTRSTSAPIACSSPMSWSGWAIRGTVSGWPSSRTDPTRRSPATRPATGHREEPRTTWLIRAQQTQGGGRCLTLTRRPRRPCARSSDSRQPRGARPRRGCPVCASTTEELRRRPRPRRPCRAPPTWSRPFRASLVAYRGSGRSGVADARDSRQVGDARGTADPRGPAAPVTDGGVPPPRSPRRPRRRVWPWAAGVAAAGLAIGLLSGRALWSDTPSAPPPPSPRRSSTRWTPTGAWRGERRAIGWRHRPHVVTTGPSILRRVHRGVVDQPGRQADGLGRGPAGALRRPSRSPRPWSTRATSSSTSRARSSTTGPSTRASAWPGARCAPSLDLQSRYGCAHPASDPPKICQARADFATRLSTRYAFSP